MGAFTKTARQREVIKEIANSDALNICLFGGSRSSKTFTNVYLIICRAIMAPKSLHLIIRETFSSAKAAIWQDTLPSVFRICFPDLPVTWNNTDYIAEIPNGSRIRISGLDDNKKVERLLGLEVSTLFISECNQVPLTAINKLKTRLAQKNHLKKRVFYDLNPSKTTTWPYQLFEQKVDPVSGENLLDPENYLSIKMNPQDNIDNIDKDYIKMLSALPELEKKRFLLGVYDDSNNGSAVYAFNESEHVTTEAIKLSGTNWIGSDFNIQWNSDVLVSQHAHGIHVWNEIQIEGDTYAKADALKRAGVTGGSIISDSTGANRSTKGKSDHIILRDAGFNVVQARNPAVIDKIANLNRCFTLGLIKIHPCCRKLIRDLKLLVWDKHGQLDQKTDPSLSHLVDGLAYLAYKLYPLNNVNYDNMNLNQRR